MKDVNEIIQEVCKYFNMDSKLVLSRRRTKTVSYVRAMCMYVCKMKTSYSYEEISEVFDRDHSTVVHAVKKIRTNKDNLMVAIDVALRV